MPAPTSELLAGKGERVGQGQESHSFLSEGKSCKHLGVGQAGQELCVKTGEEVEGGLEEGKDGGLPGQLL